MKCGCGKECGIRIWCPECEAKAIRHLKIITADLEYHRKNFERKISKKLENLKGRT